MELPCKYQDKGCKEVGGRSKMRDHLGSCIFGKIKCPIGFCPWMMSMEEVIDHLDDHDDKLVVLRVPEQREEYLVPPEHRKIADRFFCVHRRGEGGDAGLPSSSRVSPSLETACEGSTAAAPPIRAALGNGSHLGGGSGSGACEGARTSQNNNNRPGRMPGAAARRCGALVRLAVRFRGLG